MGISIGEFANERRDMEYTTPAGVLNVSYAPNVLTPSDEVKLSASRGDGVESYRQMLNIMCKMIKSWDLIGPLYNSETGEPIVFEGEQVPIKPDILQHLPSAFMGGLFRALAEDNVPKSTTPANVTPMSSPNASGNIYSGSFS